MKAAQLKLIAQFSGKSPASLAWADEMAGTGGGMVRSGSTSRRPCSAPRARPSSARPAAHATNSTTPAPRRPMSARSGTRQVSVIPGAWANTHAATNSSQDRTRTPSDLTRPPPKPERDDGASAAGLGVFGISHPATIGVPVGGGFKVAMSAGEKSRDREELQRIKDTITCINRRLEVEQIGHPKTKEEDEIFRRHVQSSDPQQMLLAKARMYELFTTKQERLIAESLKCVSSGALPADVGSVPIVALVDKTIEQHEALCEAEVRIRAQAMEMQALLGSGKNDADTVKMLKHTLHTAVEEKQTMEQHIAMLSGRLEEEKALNQALDQQREQITARVEQLQSAANDPCGECQRREIELHRSQVELDHALKTIDVMGADEQTHAEANRDLSAQLREISDEMRRLQTNCHNAFIQRDELQRQCHEYEARLQELQHVIDSERKAAAAAKPPPAVEPPPPVSESPRVDTDAMRKLEAEVAALRSEKDKLIRALDTQRQGAASLEKEAAAAREAAAAKERELAKLRGEIDTARATAEREKRALEEQRKAMAAERDALAREAEEARRRASDSDKGASAFDKDRKAFEQRIGELQKKLEEKEKALKLADNQAKKLEAATADQKQNAQMQGQMAGLRDTNQSLKQENENLKKQIELAVKRGQEAERKLKNQLESQNEELFQERENHLRTKLDLDDSIKKLQHERDDVSQQVKALQAKASEAAARPSIGSNVEKKIAYSSASPAKKDADDSVPLSELTNVKSRYEEKLKVSEKEKEAMRKENVDRYKAITDKFAEEKERLERKVNTLMDRCELLEKRVADSAASNQASVASDSKYKKRMLELYDQRLAELETVKQQYEEQLDKADTKKKTKPAAKQAGKR